MPTILSHALVAAAVGSWHRTWYPAWRHRAVAMDARLPARFWVLTACCAMLPDADVIGFAFGVRYGDLFGHRCLSHSLLFAAVSGAVVSGWCARAMGHRWRLALYFALVTASHGVLDALTDGGLGVAFLAPFDTARYFLPWRPVAVSPIGPSFFSARGLLVLRSEVVWIWTPALLLAGCGWLAGRVAAARRSAPPSRQAPFA